MKAKVLVTAIGVLFMLALAAHGQTLKRQDVIWARSTAGAAITLDGNLNEPAWANAEMVRLQYGKDAGIPGSGWRSEGGAFPSDPLDATLKFLVAGNQLYLGITAKDSSIGGGGFNNFDAVLMNLRRKNEPPNHGAFEYFLAWWDLNPNTVRRGALPAFFGPAGDRTVPANVDAWDAATTVQGITNSDTAADQGYVMEFRMNLTPRGYDVTRPEGDILSFNISLYDGDWQWPLNQQKFSRNRTWFQGPFSGPLLNTVRIHARPDVTINSGPVPDVPPEFIIPNAEHYSAPVIDGNLTEAVWQNAPSFDVKYGDLTVRATYPSIGPIASGQFQPEIGGARAFVQDPGNATFKYFFKGDMLYVGADVRDKAVWSIPTENQWDGIRFTIIDRATRDPLENYLLGRSLFVRFDPTGNLVAEEDLKTFLNKGVKAGVKIKPNTTINNFNDVDQGFFVELAIDVTKFGYSGSRGDGVVFIGANLYDGDSFANAADNYGNWAWWFKERANSASPVWAFMDPNTFVPGGEPAAARRRADVIWARSTAGAAITLDGNLNEPAWANAETVPLQYNKDAGLPGSGWRSEGGAFPSDPLDATLKFLVAGNQLYLGVTAQDSSIGGGGFNQFDAVLMNLRRKNEPPNHNPFEYFLAWWDLDPNTVKKGALPAFFGPAGDRTKAENVDAWDAVTTVQGITNSDTAADQGYVMEFRMNLTPRGYDVTTPAGDILSFNISLYDGDWQWPLNQQKFSRTRTWFQGPFSAPLRNTVRIHARPDVTVNSGPVPDVPPEVIIPSAGNNPAPVIDGNLTEAVWQKAPSFDVKYGDLTVRATYPSIGPIASGQFQPEIGGARAFVQDPGNATFRYFFKADTLYVGADVRDKAVWSIPTENQWDGIRFMIIDRATRDPVENWLVGRALFVRFDPTGNLVAEEDLKTFLDKGVKAGVKIKPNTTINNFNDVDQGFFVELAIDLTKFGYPPGRGDGVVFIGANLYDGDSFANAADNYGNWAWWFKERANNASPAWAFMNPALIVGVEEEANAGIPDRFAVLGNYPNPFNPSTTILYTVPEPGVVTLKVFDVLGRRVKTLSLGLQEPGKLETVFTPTNLSSGVYFYRLEMTSTRTRKVSSTQVGKLLLMK